MTFLLSVIMLAGVVSSVSVALFLGHALSTHTLGPVFAAAIAFAVGFGLLAVFLRLGGQESPPGS